MGDEEEGSWPSLVASTSTGHGPNASRSGAGWGTFKDCLAASSKQSPPGFPLNAKAPAAKGEEAELAVAGGQD